ncbi:MAG: segregation/condensation protein A [Planctomycetes bacterium]|nr:segregation/condensation protein A [Planctomycetota bacterium]
MSPEPASPAPPPEGYQVEVEAFHGPMDLLLYLVRKHEVEVGELPLARVADQFVRHLERMDRIDVGQAGEFLVMASTLMEIKSRALLPREPELDEDPGEDPRLALVEELLEYRRVRSAARALDGQFERASRMFDRPRAEPGGRREFVLADAPDLWALVTAFQRVARSILDGPPTIVQDETPVEVHMERILADLRAVGAVDFEDLFPAAAERPWVVGVFLALLELVRQARVCVVQERPFAPIAITLRDGATPHEPAPGA